MNKLTVPALLLGVVMIAGAFAFMPVQEASTVHTTVQGSQAQLQQAEDTTDRTSGANGENSLVTISTNNNTPFIIKSVIVCGTSDASRADADPEVGISLLTIDGDLIEGTDAAAIAVADVVADNQNSQPACVDAVVALNAANAGEVPLSWSSNGANITFRVVLGDQDDVLNSVKVVALVDGSSTIAVASGAPA